MCISDKKNPMCISDKKNPMCISDTNHKYRKVLEKGFFFVFYESVLLYVNCLKFTIVTRPLQVYAS